MLTFLLLDGLEEALDVVTLGQHVDQDVVLLPLALLLVGIHELGGSLSVEALRLLDVALLINVLLLGRGEGGPQEIQHIFFLINLHH